MPSYVWRGNQFVDKKTGEPMPKPYAGEVCRPHLWRDIPEYKSPVDGRPISSRSTRKEDMRKNGCVDYDPVGYRPRGFGNPDYAKKYGLKLSEEAVNRKRPTYIDPLADVKKR